MPIDHAHDVAALYLIHLKICLLDLLCYSIHSLKICLDFTAMPIIIIHEEKKQAFMY